MESIIATQMLIFVYSCLLGVGLGILYDFFRILRMIINPHYIGIFIQDIVYFITSGIITFIFVLSFNNGEARFYILAGEGVGWIVYHLTLGEVVYRSSSRIVKYFNFKIFCLINKIKQLKRKNIDNN